MSATEKPAVPSARRRRCPICGRPPATEFRPFCSARCADIDLGRWFGEAYRIPADEDDLAGDLGEDAG
ncbi:MAG: DNA gyrase inhibitor YacG [Rhodospirillales bacterium]|nr:DNA gyrase inhibitor YacG [Rhodospirillales bacterium]